MTNHRFTVLASVVSRGTLQRSCPEELEYLQQYFPSKEAMHDAGIHFVTGDFGGHGGWRLDEPLETTFCPDKHATHLLAVSSEESGRTVQLLNIEGKLDAADVLDHFGITRHDDISFVVPLSLSEHEYGFLWALGPADLRGAAGNRLADGSKVVPGPGKLLAKRIGDAPRSVDSSTHSAAYVEGRAEVATLHFRGGGERQLHPFLVRFMPNCNQLLRAHDLPEGRALDYLHLGSKELEERPDPAFLVTHSPDSGRPHHSPLKSRKLMDEVSKLAHGSAAATLDVPCLIGRPITAGHPAKGATWMKWVREKTPLDIYFEGGRVARRNPWRYSSPAEMVKSTPQWKRGKELAYICEHGKSLQKKEERPGPTFYFTHDGVDAEGPAMTAPADMKRIEKAVASVHSTSGYDLSTKALIHVPGGHNGDGTLWQLWKRQDKWLKVFFTDGSAALRKASRYDLPADMVKDTHGWKEGKEVAYICKRDETLKKKERPDPKFYHTHGGSSATTRVLPLNSPDVDKTMHLVHPGAEVDPATRALISMGKGGHPGTGALWKQWKSEGVQVCIFFTDGSTEIRRARVFESPASMVKSTVAWKKGSEVAYLCEDGQSLALDRSSVPAPPVYAAGGIPVYAAGGIIDPSASVSDRLDAFEKSTIRSAESVKEAMAEASGERVKLQEQVAQLQVAVAHQIKERESLRYRVDTLETSVAALIKDVKGLKTQQAVQDARIADQERQNANERTKLRARIADLEMAIGNSPFGKLVNKSEVPEEAHPNLHHLVAAVKRIFTRTA